jgi:hypothetical protein
MLLAQTMLEHNVNVPNANQALIRLAAMSAALAGVDNREEAAALFDAVWRLTYATSR